MLSPEVIAIFSFVALGAVVVFGVLALFKAFYKKVDQGHALIINKMGRTEVYFTGGLVIPVIHRAEVMDISLKTIEIDRRGKAGLICQDNIRADIAVTFFVRVNKTEEDVLKVAQAIGCERASKQDTIEALFSAKFSEALKTVGYGMDFVELYNQRDKFKDRIIEVIGTDLNGYVLEDAAIDYLEQTPLQHLDPQNILDAQGIRKITELTVDQRIRTNEFENLEKKQIRKQDVEAAEAILALDRQQAEAEAKQQREIATLRARERAETEKVVHEERLKATTAQIRTDEELAVANENKLRQVEIAQKNRQRVVLVETERVERDRALEAIGREREVELMRIEKEKALEVERKQIQDVIRQRVAVEKTVAEEEERIKDLRVTMEANRLKEQTVIAAEAEAQEKLVKDLRAAEAAEKAAAHKARERVVLAEAALEAADKEAKARIREAEGVQARDAAAGLAAARVKEADATASEKQGMANVRVQEASAEAARKVGEAEAQVLREKILAEAAGLTEKAEAMKALDAASRDHEEFRLRLEKDKEIERLHIEAQRQIAEAQAKLLGEAFKNARFDIVGGDGAFFERFVKAISLGKSIDGFLDRSETAREVFSEYRDGRRSLPQDLTDVLSRPAVGADDVQQLTLAAFLGGLMKRGDAGQRKALGELLAQARALGIDGPLGGAVGDGGKQSPPSDS